MATLLELLNDPGVKLDAITARCEALDPLARLRECRELSERQLSRLYEVASDGTPMSIEEFMGGTKDGEIIKYYGKNSLLSVISTFEKHFCRFEGAVIGINVQKMSMFSGPGYFTAVDKLDGEHVKEVLFDYTQVPSRGPAGWPKPRPNVGLLQPFIYQDLKDYNRRVSKDVCIGSASRHGKYTHQFYVLTRA
jgi:hypothetical protein